MKRRLLSYLLLISLLSTASAKEFQVNTRTNRNQANAAIATDEQGNFVVVWSSYYSYGDKSNEIRGRRFAADGSPIDANEFEINTTEAGNQKEPDVAMDVEGNFMVAWQGPGQDQNDIFAQRFEPNGQPIGSEFRVNTTTDNNQLNPSVAMNNDGDFIIVWESMDQPEPNRPICCQSYGQDGLPVGPELVISDQPSICRYPDVALDSTGEAIVVWTGKNSLYSVRVRHFAADGNAPSFGSTPVNDGLKFTSLTRPSIAVDAEGNYVIAWDGHSQGDDYDNVYLKRYHWTHAPLHEQYLVNTQQAGDQTNPVVAMSDDSFVVVWESDAESESNRRNIFGQRFINQGEDKGYPIPLGDEFQVNTYVVDDQKFSAVVMRGNGEFVAVWQSRGQDGSDYGIFADIGPAVPCADFTGDWFVNFRDYCILAEEWLKDQNPLKTDLVDDNKINGRDLDAFCDQWLRPCYDCNDVDIYTDGKIDFKDYCLWAQGYLQQGPLKGDVTGNGTVDLADLKALIFHWAKSCE